MKQSKIFFIIFPPTEILSKPKRNIFVIIWSLSELSVEIIKDVEIQASRIEHEKSLLKRRLGVCCMKEGICRDYPTLHNEQEQRMSKWEMFSESLKLLNIREEAQHILKQILYISYSYSCYPPL